MGGVWVQVLGGQGPRACVRVFAYMSVCLCVCERESVCLCDRESACMCVRERVCVVCV